MKIIRIFLTLSLLAGLTVSQLPLPATCQMRVGVSSMFYPMPCCKTHTAPAQCPQMRAALPKADLISLHSAVLTSVTKVTHSLFTIVTLAPYFQTASVRSVIESVQSLFLEKSPLVRAPPIDWVLFSA